MVSYSHSTLVHLLTLCLMHVVVIVFCTSIAVVLPISIVVSGVVSK